MIETVRKWIQSLMTFLTNGYWAFPVTRTIYQGPLKTFCAPGLNCYSCPAATLACPMGVKFNESPQDTECISCLRCMNQACKYGAISLEIAGLPTRSPAIAPQRPMPYNST